MLKRSISTLNIPIRSATIVVLLGWSLNALPQCQPTVPTFIADLSASPTATYLSPDVSRQDYCCSASGAETCIQFILTLHPQAQGIVFNICSGAIPSGSMYYQLACGPPVAVGTALCLNGAGPHIITFCKPGNNSNEYCITSLAEPDAGPDIAVNDGCVGTITSSGYDPAAVLWSSIAPGAPGAYDSYLACPTCPTTTVVAQPGFPPYVDYQICGVAIGACGNNPICHVVRVYFFSTLTATIQPTNPTVCYGAAGTTITAVGGGGTPPYTYLWNTGATTPSIYVGVGTYTVQVSDTSDCPPTTASVVVTSFTQPIQALAGSDIIVCGDGLPVQLNSSVTGASGGQWLTGNGVFTPSNTSLSGTYMPTAAEIASGSVALVLATTGNGTCPGDTDTLLVSFSNSFITATTTSTNATCANGNNGSASFLPFNPTFTYAWDDPAAQNTATAYSLSAGNYTVTVTDMLGCDTTLNVTIGEPTALSVDQVNIVAPSCNGYTNGSASLTLSGGTPGYTVFWNNGQTGPLLTNVAAGNYTATIMDSQGCTTQAQATITQPAPLNLTVQAPDTVCVNTPVTLTALGTGGTGALQYSWSGLGTANPMTYAFQVSQVVQVTVTDQAGCIGPTVPVPITVLDLSTATLTTYGDTTVCPNGSATVGAALTGYPGSYTISWPDLGYFGNGPFVVPVNSNLYLDVIVTDVCGNALSAIIPVLLDVPPTVQLPPLIAEGCAPLTVQMPDLQLGSGISYQWNLGDGSLSGDAMPVVTYQAGNYPVNLTVTTAAGCTATAPTAGQVIAYAPPTAAFTSSTSATDIDNASITFNDESAPAIAAWSWTFGDGGTSNVSNPSYAYSDIGNFQVNLLVTDIHGCTDEATGFIIINPVYDVVIPNAFTPNINGGSGGVYDPNNLDNDIFYPFSRFVKDFRMRIFNRWGELIFESSDLNLGWDGYYLGELCQQDVYVVQTWIRFVDDKEVQKLTDLTLFR